MWLRPSSRDWDDWIADVGEDNNSIED